MLILNLTLPAIHPTNHKLQPFLGYLALQPTRICSAVHVCGHFFTQELKIKNDLQTDDRLQIFGVSEAECRVRVKD